MSHEKKASEHNMWQNEYCKWLEGGIEKNKRTENDLNNHPKTGERRKDISKIVKGKSKAKK